MRKQWAHLHQSSIACVCFSQVSNKIPLFKAVENQAGKPSSHSPLHAEQSSQCMYAVEDNPAVEPSGEASGTSAVPVQDRSGNNLIKPGSSGIDASVDSSSRCDSLEGNWGSVSGTNSAGHYG